MSDTATAEALDGSEERISGTDAAVQNFVDTDTMSFGYLLVALALAVAWWQTIGAMSAWVAGIGLIVLSFGAPHAIALVNSLRWSTADGVVVESDVLTEQQAREYSSDADTATTSTAGSKETGYVPLVRYQFTVDGTRYESARISPFDDTVSRRRRATAVVDEYPQNKHVTVRYDPDDPTNSQLQPLLRSQKTALPAIGAVMLGAAVWFAAGMPGGAPVLMTALGVTAGGFGFYQFRRGFGSRNWPKTTATVTGTSISVRSGGEDSSTSYKPECNYEYEVDGTSYVGSRYSFGGAKDPSFSSREEARRFIEENWQDDGEISVRYNPKQPDVSVVVPGARRSLILVLVGLAFIAGAVIFYLYG